MRSGRLGLGSRAGRGRDPNTLTRSHHDLHGVRTADHQAHLRPLRSPLLREWPPGGDRAAIAAIAAGFGCLVLVLIGGAVLGIMLMVGARQVPQPSPVAPAVPAQPPPLAVDPQPAATTPGPDPSAPQADPPAEDVDQIAIAGEDPTDSPPPVEEAARQPGPVERAAQVQSEPPVVAGSLPAATIQRVVRAHVSQLRFCYERELVRAPEVEGRVLVAFTIGADGAVAAAEVAESSLQSPPVEACVLRRVRRWRFPEPEGEGLVSVRYPFVFEAEG